MNIEAYLDGSRAVRIFSENGPDDARELLDRASRIGVEKIEILNIRQRRQA